ncbi:MAG: ribonuclease III [Oscillospiraceae bacterium]|nr:ribonuclease III [Oscillospiraceae bacterium]
MDYFDLHLNREEQLAISALGLAHLGDGVYELMVRSWLIVHGYAKKANLHRETVARVRAPYQAAAMKRIEPMLTSEELAVSHRGRNAHVGNIPKNASRGEYAHATALEALFGWLYLNGKKDRLNELFAFIMEGEDDAA